MKLLLLNVLAAAITCSSLGFKTQTNVRRETKISEHQETPKLAGPKNRLITVPIEYDGGGGGSSSVPEYSESETYYSHNYNDFSRSPTFVGEYGKMTGQLVHHDEMETYNYQVGEIDVDWYRFSTTVKYNYSFSFTAPNTNYYYELYRFANNNVSYYADSHALLHSSRYGSRSFQITLQPATYFVKVTSTSVSAISSTPYSVTYSRDDNFPNDIQSLTLTDQVFSSTGIVLWENENVPANMDRWNKQNQSLGVYYTSDYPYTFIEGYLDPNFITYSNWTQGGVLSPDGRYTLDSIMYVGGEKALSDCKTILNKLLYETSLSQYSSEIASMKLTAQENGFDAVTGGVSLLLTLIVAVYTGPGALLVEKIVNTVSVVVTCIETASALAEALSFVNNDTSHLVTGYDVGCNLRNLYERCCELLKPNAPAKYLRIPKYSYLYIGNAGYNYPSGAKAVKVATTWFLKSPNVYGDEYFFVSKNYAVKKNQFNIDDRLLRGKITRYVDFKDFWDKTNPVVARYDGGCPSGCDLEYEITKRKDGKYYLNAYNYCSINIPITFNTTSVNSEEAKYFNLMANSYGRETVKPGEKAIICMEDRTYLYVREYSNNQIKKIFLHQDGYTTFTGAGSTNFGMEFLKISVVKKEGSIWTIRIRNLYTTGITAHYNYKMCNGTDAKNWSGLRHPASVYIPCSGTKPYADVQISENGWVRYIAISHIIGNVRYVSYAKGLDPDGDPVDYYTNTVYLY